VTDVGNPTCAWLINPKADSGVWCRGPGLISPFGDCAKANTHGTAQAIAMHKNLIFMI